ncbi:MAG: helix-turn-helix domain-containing protein [Alphaproteobacteria bacterium]|nr:helix-turn-helix domain-containing protein [Alphaproteobacteria bacterium]
MRSPYLNAAEAAARLGIKPASLYVYVSRGLLRSEPGEGRSRRYRSDDIDRLMAKRDGVEGALDFGAPVLDSALTRIAEGSFAYRGRDAIKLAPRTSLEDIACLLWNTQAGIAFAPRNLPAPLPWPKASSATTRLQAALPLAGSSDPDATARDPKARAASAGRVLRLVAGAIAGKSASARPCDTVLAQSWKLDRKGSALVRSALVLCADHELNPSSFVARCVASTGASLYDAVAAGLAALQGPRHGGASRRTEAWLREIDGADDIPKVIAERARRGERFPGTGHPLYPMGDPRGAYLIDALAASYPRDDEQKRVRQIADAVAIQTGVPANIDFALAALARVLKLPEDAPMQIFTLGRTVGWLAHALEQQDSGRLIRPRARYIGPI